MIPDIRVIILTSLLTFLSAKFYILFFKGILKKSFVPTGFGISLSLTLLIGFFFNRQDEYIYSLTPCVIFILIGSLIYFLDDIYSLSPIIRMSISSIVSLLIVENGFKVEFLSIENSLYLLVISIVLIITIGLVNVFNFYDGADLNLTSLIFLTGLILKIFNTENLLLYTLLGSILIGYSIGFGLINRKPKHLYLGDSGSFSIALLFLTLLLSSYFKSIPIFIHLLALISFPIFDVFYVLLIRVYFSHNLLSRNYLHLYQRLNIEKQNFNYLIPVVFNFLIFIIFKNIFIIIGFPIFLASSISIFLFTPLNYLSLRYFLVKKKYFFGDGKNE